MTLFDLFFTTHISAEMRLRTFSTGHWILLLSTLFLISLAAAGVPRLSPESRQRLLLGCTWAIPCIYLLRFVVFALLDAYVEPQMPLADRLPFHLCPLNSVVMPIAVLTQNRTLLNYLYAISMPAAIAAMFTPAMSYYGLYAWFSWQVVFFFVEHGMMAAVAVLAIRSRLFRPDIRALPGVAALFLGYAAIIYPVNLLTGQNYLFLHYPDQGTVMAFFAQYLGNPGYLLPLAGLTVLIVFLLYLPWWMADKKLKRYFQP